MSATVPSAPKRTRPGNPMAGSPTHATASEAGGSRKPARLVSLDAYRGFIMTMLAANGFGILAFSRIAEDAPVWQSHDRSWWQQLAVHFDHPVWVSMMGSAGVSFWDLIQPAFMFMVGVSMPFSYGRREMQGQGSFGRMLHALLRSVVLILLGVFLSSTGSDRTHWVFPNVLSQIGLGYFFAWMLLNTSTRFQLAALALILIGDWGWFRMNPPPANYDYAAVGASKEKGEVFEGKFAAWSKNANAAFRFDHWFLPLLRMDPPPKEEPSAQNPAPDANTVAETPDTADPTGEIADARQSPPTGWFRRWFFASHEPYEPNRGGYTTLNFIPSIGTTLLGILCGQLLLSGAGSHWRRLGILIAGAALCLGLGVLAHNTVCPIVKRIWTPSWVLFSGGYVIGILALFYLLFDILPLRRLAFPLVVVGMNSILIYMMGQLIRGWTTRNVVRTHLGGMIESIFGPRALDPLWFAPVTEATATFVVFWLFLFWLYRQRIFLRI